MPHIHLCAFSLGELIVYPWYGNSLNENKTPFVLKKMFDNHFRDGKSLVEILESLNFTLQYWFGGVGVESHGDE